MRKERALKIIDVLADGHEGAQTLMRRILDEVVGEEVLKSYPENDSIRFAINMRKASLYVIKKKCNSKSGS